MVLSPSPNETGFAAVAGAGTELGAVGTLAELPSRGWCCHRTLRKLALRPSWGVVLSPNPEEAGTAAELGVVLSPNPEEAGIAAELHNLEAI